MSFKKHLFLGLLLVIIHHVRSQDFEMAAVPSWVAPVNPTIESEVTKYDINTGFYTSLFDYQINLDNQSEYNHSIVEVLTSSGVTQASQLYISYDTSYQEVLFHDLKVWRNGAAIDKTEQLSFEILKNEQNLNSGIYTGLITAYDIIEDVRKGDRIEYSYTIIGTNPIFEGNIFRLVPLETYNPIDYLSLNVLFTDNGSFDYRCSGCENQVSKSEINGVTKLEYSKPNIKSVEFEPSAPSWHVPYNYFEIANYGSWKKVNEWATGIFQLDIPPDFSDIFSQILPENMDDDAKINALINFVQDDINYMGIETGIGSIKPFTPNQVLAQRFGDCKDKSLLLATMLRSIGVENSYPVLVNTVFQHNLNQFLPGGQLFDHCIVKFELNNKSYWIDPTAALQGGTYQSINTFDYGLALVIDGNTEKLTMMAVNDIAKTEIYEKIKIDSYTEPGVLEVETKMYGAHADYLRTILEYYSVKELSDDYRNAYSYVFPNISSSSKMQVKDDEEQNIMTTIETYTIEEVWKITEENFYSRISSQYEPVSLYTYINSSNCEKKEYPVVLNHPAQFVQKTDLMLPEAMELKKSVAKEDNEFFKFKKETELLSKTVLSIKYEYESKEKEVSPEEYNALCKSINGLVDDLPLMIYYNKLKDSKPKKTKNKSGK